MTEKLGVLLLELPEPSREFNYLCYENTDCHNNKLTVNSTDNPLEVDFYGYKCTKEEAQKYPQFRWVALEDLK